MRPEGAGPDDGNDDSITVEKIRSRWRRTPKIGSPMKKPTGIDVAHASATCGIRQGVWKRDDTYAGIIT
jgi:hypothetical protein